MVPENIHTHPTDDHWKFKRGVGSQKPNFLKESMELNWNFWRGGGGGGGSNQKNTHDVGMDIFWNHIITY